MDKFQAFLKALYVQTETSKPSGKVGGDQLETKSSLSLIKVLIRLHGQKNMFGFMYILVFLSKHLSMRQ